MFTFFITLKCFDLFLYVSEYFQTNKKVFTLLFFKSNVGLSDINPDSLNFSMINKLNSGSYFSYKTNRINVSNHLEFFRIPSFNGDCFRFNAVTYKRVELYAARSTEDYFRVDLPSSYRKFVDANKSNNYYIRDLLVYISDKHLNSFEKLETFGVVVFFMKSNVIRIRKESTETKLPPPFNPCQEPKPGGEPYHRWNCIEACVARDTNSEFSCTFPFGLFAVTGYKRCGDSWSFYWERFSEKCQK